MHAMWWIWFPLFMLFFLGPFRRRRYWRYRQWRDAQSDGEGRPGAQSVEREREQRIRDEQVELMESRIAELESRLDFTERLLAQRREPPLSGPSPA